MSYEYPITDPVVISTFTKAKIAEEVHKMQAKLFWCDLVIKKFGKKSELDAVNRGYLNLANEIKQKLPDIMSLYGIKVKRKRVKKVKAQS